MDVFSEQMKTGNENATVHDEMLLNFFSELPNSEVASTAYSGKLQTNQNFGPLKIAKNRYSHHINTLFFIICIAFQDCLV